MTKARLKVDWTTFAGAALFLLVGSIFSGLGGYHVTTTWDFTAQATEVQALVAVNRADCDDDDGCTYWPTVTFDTPEGQSISARTRYGSPDYGWPEGSRVTVLYSPAYDYVLPTGVLNLWFFGVGFLGLGLFALGIGGWLMARMVFSRVPDPG